MNSIRPGLYVNCYKLVRVSLQVYIWTHMLLKQRIATPGKLVVAKGLRIHEIGDLLA